MGHGCQYELDDGRRWTVEAAILMCMKGLNCVRLHVHIGGQ